MKWNEPFFLQNKELAILKKLRQESLSNHFETP